MAPFYRWASIASRLDLLRGDMFSIKFPEIPGTHFRANKRTRKCLESDNDCSWS